MGMAEDAVTSGAALDVLDRFAALTNGLAPAGEVAR